MDPIVREILEAELDEARAEIELQAAEMARLQRELESRMGFHRRARERSVALEEALRNGALIVAAAKVVNGWDDERPMGPLIEVLRQTIRGPSEQARDG